MSLYWALLALAVLGTHAQIVFESDTAKEPSTAPDAKGAAEEKKSADGPQARFLGGLFGGGGSGLFGGGGDGGGSGLFGGGSGLFPGSGGGGLFDSCRRCSSFNIQQSQSCCEQRQQCCQFATGSGSFGGGGRPVFVGPPSGLHGDRHSSFSGQFGQNQFGGGPGFSGIPPHLGGGLSVGPPGHIGIGSGFGGGRDKLGICPRPDVTKDFLGIRSLPGDTGKKSDQPKRVKRQDKTSATESEKSSDPQARIFGSSGLLGFGNSGVFGGGHPGGFPGGSFGSGHHGGFPVGPGFSGGFPVGPGLVGGNSFGFSGVDECITDAQCPGHFKCCFNSRSQRQCSTPLFV